MNMRILIAGFLLIFSTSALFAQELKFDKDFHNFGKLQPNAKEQSHEYKFTNTGNKPLQIKKVQESCGCTATEWTKSPVKPGEKGKVVVSFDPRGKTGYQQKDVKVITNARNSPHYLLFEAYILERQVRNRSSFEYDFGSLSLNTDFVDFGNIPLGESNTTKVKLRNNGDSAITIQNISTSRKIFARPATPFQLNPGQTQAITLRLRSNGNPSELGIFEGDVEIRSSEYPNQPYPVTGVAIFYPNIPQPDPNEKSPKISFKKKELNFGTLSQGAALKTKFNFENTGDEVLTVYKVQSGGCSCTMPQRFRDKKIKPGEKDRIRVTFDSESLKGPQDKKIYVFTNDPSNPLVVLSIKGEITP